MILALALGVAFSNGSVARVEITHKGPPTPVSIVAIDKDNKEIPVSHIPSRIVTRTGRAVVVRTTIPPTAAAICVVYNSPSARLLSCSARLNQQAHSSSSRNASRRAGYQSTLQRALAAARQVGTELPLRLSVPVAKAPE